MQTSSASANFCGIVVQRTQLSHSSDFITEVKFMHLISLKLLCDCRSECNCRLRGLTRCLSLSPDYHSTSWLQATCTFFLITDFVLKHLEAEKFSTVALNFAELLVCSIVWCWANKPESYVWRKFSSRKLSDKEATVNRWICELYLP